MYIPHTDAERESMLAAIGKKELSELFEAIPADYRFPDLNLQPGLSEPEAAALLDELAQANLSLDRAVCFTGAGAYNHYIPAAVDALVSQSNFFTAYTPYQPEISQGTLQGVFEFQSLIARLTGMDTANASHYDGATACAEAGIMAYHHFRGKRKRIITSPGLHPHYRAVMETYLNDFDGMTVETPELESLSDAAPQPLSELIDQDTALVVVQYPDFFGQIHDFTALAEEVHQQGALLCICVNPTALGLLKTPGEMGADIVTGEGQPLGIPLSFGGPYLGLFAARKELVRKISGRIVGETVDNRGQRGYVLTLTAREQHIRREKATSNICSNQGLNALTAAVYLSLLGKDGLKTVARQCYDKTHYAAKKLGKLKGFKVLNPGPFFHEFVLVCPESPSILNEHLLEHEILGGYDLSEDFPALGNAMLIAVTETISKEDIDSLCEILTEGSGHHGSH
jgi:glycine dehydrogenase subunit 1